MFTEEMKLIHLITRSFTKLRGSAFSPDTRCLLLLPFIPFIFYTLFIFQLFQEDPDAENLRLFENGVRTPTKQEFHTQEAVDRVEKDLKTCLTRLVHHLFGKGILYRKLIQPTRSYFCFCRCGNSVDWGLFSIHSSIIWTGSQVPRKLVGIIRLWSDWTADSSFGYINLNVYCHYINKISIFVSWGHWQCWMGLWTWTGTNCDETVWYSWHSLVLVEGFWLLDTIWRSRT